MRFCVTLAVLASLSHVWDVRAQDVHSQPVEMTHQGDRWQRVESGDIGIPRGGTLRISARGRVVVRGSDGPRISYRLIQRVRAHSQEDAHQRFTGSLNSFVASRSTLTLWPTVSDTVVTLIEVNVPRGLANVIVQSTPGDIEAYDLDGNVSATTPAGQIRCDSIRGGFEASTGGGEIHLGRVGGQIRCVNGAGSIVVDSAGGSANCQSASGEIQIHEAAGPLVLATDEGNIQVDRAASTVEAHTAEGVIEIARADGMVFADTRGGAIEIGAARGVRCQSGSGAVRVRAVSGPMQVQTALGSIVAELIAGAHLQDSSLVAGSGDITVMIPSNVALSVLARNDSGNDSGVNPRIVSDFSELRARTIALARPSEPAVYQGAIHGGGPLLRLETAGGIIYVRKSK